MAFSVSSWSCPNLLAEFKHSEQSWAVPWAELFSWIRTSSIFDSTSIALNCWARAAAAATRLLVVSTAAASSSLYLDSGQHAIWYNFSTLPCFRQLHTILLGEYVCWPLVEQLERAWVVKKENNKTKTSPCVAKWREKRPMNGLIFKTQIVCFRNVRAVQGYSFAFCHSKEWSS